MRVQKHFTTCIALTTLLFAGFATGSMAQVTDIESEAPVISSTSPAYGESNVDVDTDIEIRFSTEMDESTINANTIKLLKDAAGSMRGEQEQHQEHHMNDNDAEEVEGSVSYSGRVATFTPGSDLEEGARYTIIVTTAVRNTENVALETEYSSSFTTRSSDDSSYSDSRDDDFRMDRGDRDNRVDRGIRDDRGDRSDRSDRDQYTSQNNKVDLGKAGNFVILAKSTINHDSESRITGQTGEGSDSYKQKEEQNFVDSTRQRTDDDVIVWRSDRTDSDTTATAGTSNLEVNEAIDDMIVAFKSVSMKSQEESMRDRSQDRDMNRDRDMDSRRSGEAMRHQNGNFRDAVLTAGVHEWDSSIDIDYNVNLSGSEDDVWLFKVSNNLDIDEDITITLTDGARAENIFWIVDGSVNIGKNVQFEGTILSVDDITLEEGARVNGRLFSQSSVNLNGNTVTEPSEMAGRASTSSRR